MKIVFEHRWGIINTHDREKEGRGNGKEKVS